jgi:hypothetical protein
MTLCLLKFLNLPFEEHHPFVWRLLYEAMLNRPDKRILVAAKGALKRSHSPRSLAEIKRIEEKFAVLKDQQ